MLHTTMEYIIPIYSIVAAIVDIVILLLCLDLCDCFDLGLCSCYLFRFVCLLTSAFALSCLAVAVLVEVEMAQVLRVSAEPVVVIRSIE